MGSESALKKSINAGWPVAAVLVSWISLSLALTTLGALLDQDLEPPGFLVPLSFFLHLMLLSWSCALFSLRQEPLFTQLPPFRPILLLCSLGVGVGFYFARYKGGASGDLIEVLASANLIVFALLVGNYLVSALKQAAELVPVCVVMSVADLFSVFLGPSKRMAAGVEDFYRGGREGPVPGTDFLLVKMAVPGMDYLMPVFGVADLIMLAFLVAAAKKFRIDDNLAGPALDEMASRGRQFPYLPAGAIGLAAAVAAAQWLGLFLPALPVMAVLFLGLTLPRNPPMRLLRRTDWTVVLVGCGVLIGLIALGGAGF